ncbi:hypothetical protein HK405_011884, partial [Cladochytrium tenue]
AATWLKGGSDAMIGWVDWTREFSALLDTAVRDLRALPALPAAAAPAAESGSVTTTTSAAAAVTSVTTLPSPSPPPAPHPPPPQPAPDSAGVQSRLMNLLLLIDTLGADMQAQAAFLSRASRLATVSSTASASASDAASNLTHSVSLNQIDRLLARPRCLLRTRHSSNASNGNDGDNPAPPLSSASAPLLAADLESNDDIPLANLVNVARRVSAASTLGDSPDQKQPAPRAAKQLRRSSDLPAPPSSTGATSTPMTDRFQAAAVATTNTPSPAAATVVATSSTAAPSSPAETTMSPAEQTLLGPTIAWPDLVRRNGLGSASGMTTRQKRWMDSFVSLFNASHLGVARGAAAGRALRGLGNSGLVRLGVPAALEDAFIANLNELNDSGRLFEDRTLQLLQDEVATRGSAAAAKSVADAIAATKPADGASTTVTPAPPPPQPQPPAMPAPNISPTRPPPMSPDAKTSASKRPAKRPKASPPSAGKVRSVAAAPAAAAALSLSASSPTVPAAPQPLRQPRGPPTHSRAPPASNLASATATSSAATPLPSSSATPRVVSSADATPVISPAESPPPTSQPTSSVEPPVAAAAATPAVPHSDHLSKLAAQLGLVLDSPTASASASASASATAAAVGLSPPPPAAVADKATPGPPGTTAAVAADDDEHHDGDAAATAATGGGEVLWWERERGALAGHEPPTTTSSSSSQDAAVRRGPSGDEEDDNGDGAEEEEMGEGGFPVVVPVGRNGQPLWFAAARKRPRAVDASSRGGRDKGRPRKVPRL